MIGGYMSGVIVRPFRSMPFPSYFFSGSFGLVFSASFRLSVSRYSASPSIEFGMKFRTVVIFSVSASEGLKFSTSSFVKGIEAYPVFSWREYGALNRWRGDTRTMSTESSVDFIVTSSLNPVCLDGSRTPPLDPLASSFAVFILQDSQYWISRFDILLIFPLHVGHIISFLFDFMDST